VEELSVLPAATLLMDGSEPDSTAKGEPAQGRADLVGCAREGGADAVIQHGVPGDPEHAVLLAPQPRAKPMTSPAMGRLSGGPCRAGVAVTVMDGRAPLPMVEVCQGVRPTALPPSRWAPAVVVRTTPADGSRARPASSRLSPWWSWLSRTASIGGRSAMATAGPVVL
jgi:hypothetical protein